jgi:hypothetical protein
MLGARGRAPRRQLAADLETEPLAVKDERSDHKLARTPTPLEPENPV